MKLLYFGFAIYRTSKGNKSTLKTKCGENIICRNNQWDVVSKFNKIEMGFNAGLKRSNVSVPEKNAPCIAKFDIYIYRVKMNTLF